MGSRKLFVILLCVLVLGTTSAFAGTVTIIPSTSTASGTSTPINTGGACVLNIMVIGTGFSGSVVVSQGPDDSNITTTKTLTLSSYTGKSEYYSLMSTTITNVDFTRSAGSLVVKLEYYPCVKQ